MICQTKKRFHESVSGIGEPASVQILVLRTGKHGAAISGFSLEVELPGATKCDVNYIWKTFFERGCCYLQQSPGHALETSQSMIAEKKNYFSDGGGK